MDLKALRLARRKVRENAAHVIWKIANGEVKASNAWVDVQALAIIEMALDKKIAEMVRGVD